jgi:hypothetical protein
MSTTETRENALARIKAGFSRNNFIAVQYFAACGIDPADIDPRKNVLTYNAWKTTGRQIARGAKGLPVTVWIPTNKRDENGKAQMLPKTCRLFHISQTVDADAPKDAAPAAAGNEYLIATDDTTDAARIARFEESTTKGTATHELSKLEAEDAEIVVEETEEAPRPMRRLVTLSSYNPTADSWSDREYEITEQAILFKGATIGTIRQGVIVGQWSAQMGSCSRCFERRTILEAAEHAIDDQNKMAEAKVKQQQERRKLPATMIAEPVGAAAGCLF